MFQEGTAGANPPLRCWLDRGARPHHPRITRSRGSRHRQAEPKSSYAKPPPGYLCARTSCLTCAMWCKQTALSRTGHPKFASIASHGWIQVGLVMEHLQKTWSAVPGAFSQKGPKPVPTLVTIANLIGLTKRPQAMAGTCAVDGEVQRDRMRLMRSA